MLACLPQLLVPIFIKVLLLLETFALGQLQVT